jgi:hypothetical protein
LSNKLVSFGLFTFENTTFGAKLLNPMKIKCLLIVVLVLISGASYSSSLSPADSVPPKNWTLKSIFGLNGTQTSFVNWAAGGRNNISILGFLDANAKYQKGNLKWNTDLKFALGGLKYMDSTGRKQGLQKTDDRIDLSSSFGYEFKKKWFYTVLAGFKTQSLDGFNFPNDSVRISTFMAPAYLSISAGIEYAPSKTFNCYLSPVAGKVTIVNNQVLADAGAFGVAKATFDPVTGLMLTEGKRVRNEFGAYFRVKFEKEIFKNIEMKTRIELFSNYMNNPQNIDVNAENIFAFKVNEWFSASLIWNYMYDDDIDIRDAKGGFGPRSQFKSVLGVGISYTMSNTPKKK